jgi:hypothetical protein
MLHSFTAILARGVFFYWALTVFSALPPTNPIADLLSRGSPPAAAAAPYCTSDADANGASDALTDGLLIIRHLFGFSGATLADGALANDATRTDPAEIAVYLEANSTPFDVDANGVTDALTDGLLIIRRLFGFSGTTLTDGAVASDANRTDPTEIGVYIDALGTCTSGQLNDTGIDWGGDYPDGNNATCTSNIAAPQDCDYGRDVTHSDDSDGHAGFSFTKLDAAGNELPASATEWICVRDNVTDLTWEVKTDDGGIHDKDNTYRWGGKSALGDGTWGTYYDDWDTLVDGSNEEGLCGFTDWRVPTIKELEGLVDASSYNPAIDPGYFPNTVTSSGFWSSVPAADDLYYAWSVNFYPGSSQSFYRNSGHRVRLVRSGQ